MQMHTVLGEVSLHIVIWSHLVLLGVVERNNWQILGCKEKAKKRGDREV